MHARLEYGMPGPNRRSMKKIRAVIPLAVFCIAYAAFFLVHFQYYKSSDDARRQLPTHAYLRSGGPVGLLAGIVAGGLILWNLAYLARRSGPVRRLLPPSAPSRVKAHAFTGLASSLLVLTHAGFTLRNSVGGHALIALGAVVLSGSLCWYVRSRRASGSLIGQWRTLHRWIAMLMVLLAALHVGIALRYASFSYTPVRMADGGAR